MFRSNFLIAGAQRHVRKSLAMAMFVLCFAPVAAPALTVLYPAPTGSVTSTMIVTMNFSSTGNAVLSPALSGCYLGQRCSFTGSAMTYLLPDGSTAALSNFSGVFKPINGLLYSLTGQASGVDSMGRHVFVSHISVTMDIRCTRGCTKTYVSGSLRIRTV